jgi:hypothetical protein
LTSDGAVPPTPGKLCDIGVQLAAVTGGSIMLVTDDLLRGSLHATDAVSASLEELQFTLGEGPCLDAYRQGRPVLVHDLGTDDPHRWAGFTSAAVDLGAGAVFGFPVQVGVTRLGTLNLYRDRAGKLSDDQHADTLVMAEVMGRAVIDMQARAPAGTLATEWEAGNDFYLVVHQASGMMSVQLEVTVGEALVRLRAFAFGEGRSLSDVASDVVSRQLRFGPPGAATSPS